jgi:glycosyl transferase, family 25
MYDQKNHRLQTKEYTMQAYVITIKDHEGSNECADRLIKSGEDGLAVPIIKFDAITPKDNVNKMFELYNIPIRKFVDEYSVQENAMACFLSHYLLWQKCAAINEEIMIFEHDAVIMNNIPWNTMGYKGLVSFGAPSYGRYNIPPKLGMNKLVSKEYLPGAHAYMIKPSAAKIMMERAVTSSEPTDIFLSNKNLISLKSIILGPYTCVTPSRLYKKKKVVSQNTHTIKNLK